MKLRFFILLLLLSPGHLAWSADDDEKEDKDSKAESSEQAPQPKAERKNRAPKVFLPAIAENPNDVPIVEEFEFNFEDFGADNSWKRPSRADNFYIERLENVKNIDFWANWIFDESDRKSYINRFGLDDYDAKPSVRSYHFNAPTRLIEELLPRRLAPRRRAPEPTPTPGKFEVAPAANGDRFAQDIVQILQALVKPGDPNITVEWGDDFGSNEVKVTVEPLRGATIFLQPGVFAQTKSLSDVAAILALELAKVKPMYEAENASMLYKLSVPKDADPQTFIREQYEKIKDDQSESAIEQKRALLKAFLFLKQTKKYDSRKDNRDLKEILAETGFKIEMNGETERNLRAAMDAIERLVGSVDDKGSSGGFDPWGMLTAKRAELNREEFGTRQKGFIRKTYDRFKNRERDTKTGAMELEFMEKYILVLENRAEGNFARLIYRGQPLTPEQERTHKTAKLKQTVSFGPAMQDFTYLTGTTAAILAIYYKGAQMLASTADGFKWGGNRFSEFFSATWDFFGSLWPKSEPKPVSEKPVDWESTPAGPSSWQRFWDWLGSFWPGGGGSETMEEKGPSMWESIWKNLSPPEFIREPLGKFFEPIGNAFSWVGTDVIKPVADAVAIYGWETGKIAVPVAIVHAVERSLLSPLRLRTANFLGRYRHNLQGQAQLLLDLMEADRTGAPPERMARLVARENLLAEFIEDGRNPTLERMRNRIVYKLLFERGSFWHIWHRSPQNAMGRFRRGVLKRVEEELKAEYQTRGNTRAPSDREIRKVARAIAYPEMMLHPSKEDAGLGEVPSKVDEIAMASTNYQVFLYWMMGALAQKAGESNTELILNILDKRLSDPNLPAADREKYRTVLERMNAIEYFRGKTQAKYVDVWRKHYPDSPIAKLKTVTDVALGFESKEVPAFVAKLRSRQLLAENLTPQQRAELLTVFVKNAMYSDAARLLYHSLDLIAGVAHDKDTASSFRSETRWAIRKLFENWDQVKFGFGLDWAAQSFLLKGILLKAMSLQDPNVRFAFGTHLTDAVDPKSGPFDQKFLQALRLRMQALGKIESGTALIDAMENLHSNYDAETRYLAELFLENLAAHPENIKSLADIERVLRSELPWHRLDSVAKGSAATWEQKLFDRYANLATKYPSYNYNPGHSEKVQIILMKRFEALFPDATPEQRLELWKLMAKRGPTGVTDSLIDDVLKKIAPESARKEANEALEAGLIWDPQIRARLYKRQAESRIDGHTLNQIDASTWKEFLDRIKSFQESKPKAHEIPKKLAEFMTELEAMQFLKPEKKEAAKERLRQALSPSNGKRTSRERREKRAALFPEPQSLLGEFASEVTFPKEREKIISEEMKVIRQYFPESGYSTASLLDWMSHRLRTRQSEAAYVKEKFLEHNTDDKDLAFSVVNEIVDEAMGWDPVERWALIRWLRGSGPIPELVKKKMRRMGPETVRRLYTTLPTLVRSSFISTILGAPRVGLLEGSGKHLYYEQVLNEIMPANESTADIASELLESFLIAMEKVSNPAKRRAVLSYLLAHPVEQSDTGNVLKNLLEAYGVPGIKLGQILAAGDFLPDHVRNKLSDLHDHANEPFRHEIYERLKETLKTDAIEPLFIVEDLKGSASMKYAVTVIDRDGKRHLIQVKREEAEAALLRNFEEMKVIVTELIKLSPQRYAFLKGMVQATKDAIRRELSLIAEGKKAVIAREEYNRLDLGKDVKVEVAQTSPLIEQVAPDKSSLYQLRSSEFASGGNIREFSPEAQQRMSEIILQGERDLLFPADGRTTHVDPDRHPGNIIWAYDSETGELLYRYKPIDWGQQYELRQADRDRVIELMSYSQLFEHIGAEPRLVDALIASVGIAPEKQASLRRAISKYFPNTSGSPRSILGPFYYLLSSLEDAGMKSNMLYYDFIKGIFQLEVYEERVRGKEHASPKDTFRDRVLAKAAELVQVTDSSLMGKIRYALSNPDPRKWKVAARNADLHEQGKLETEKFLAEMGVSQDTRSKVLNGLTKEQTAELNQAERLVSLLEGVAKETSLAKADRDLISRWLLHPRLDSIRQALPALSSEEVRNLMNVQSVLNEVQSRSEKNRRSIPLPEVRPFLSGVRDVYLAELLNSVFWTIYDRDPHIAMNWLSTLPTVSKHAGFAAFAATHSGVKSLVNRRVPTSMRGTRYMLGNGLGVALSMLASDVAHRLLAGESFAEILADIATTEYATELGWNTSTFLAAELVAENAFTALGSRLPTSVRCNYLYRKLAPLTATFVGSEAINRTVGHQLRQAGILPTRPEARIDALSKEFGPLIGDAMDNLDQLIGSKHSGKAWKALLGTDLSDFHYDVRLEEGRPVVSSAGNAGRTCRDAKSGVCGVLNNYLEKLRELRMEVRSPKILMALETEIKWVEEARDQLLRRVYKKSSELSDSDIKDLGLEYSREQGKFVPRGANAN